MIHYEVTLMHKRTFQGKKVLVEARDTKEAFSKALSAQHRCGGPSIWATLIAKAKGMETTKSKFQHKGIRYSK